MAGVVGHSVSELGKRGGSPTIAFNGSADKTELACFSQEDFVGEGC
jgi:hypothetical protein